MPNVGLTRLIVSRLSQAVATVYYWAIKSNDVASFDFGSQLVPATADFTLVLEFRMDSGDANGWIASQGGGFNGFFIYRGSATNINFFGVNGLSMGLADTAGNFKRLTITRVGSAWTMTILDLVTNTSTNTSGTNAGSIGGTAGNFLLSGNTNSNRADATYASLAITTGGVTTSFAFQDGPGAGNTNRDLAYTTSSGGSGTITNAIVGGTVAATWVQRAAFGLIWILATGLWNDASFWIDESTWID